MNACQKLQAQATQDRAAACNILLDARPDLTAQQRVRLLSIGLQEGPGVLRRDLVVLAPPPSPHGAAARGGSGAPAKVMPSGNPKMNTLFRIMPEDDDSDGVEVPTDGSALIRLSVAKAFPRMKRACNATVQAAMAKTKGGR